MEKIKLFLKRHWMDVLVVAVLIVLLILGGRDIYFRFRLEKKIRIFNNYFIVNQGYQRLLEGLKNTGIIALMGLLIGFLLGTLIAVIKVIPPYKKAVRYAQKVCTFYVAVFRGTPVVVQLLVGYYILLPVLGMRLPPVSACVFIFGLNSAAYISEIMRGGINSVDGGQLEAARALGLPFSTSMLKVVVPQAFKNILPTLGNEFIALIKETAVVGFVGAVDITRAFQDLGSNSYEYMIPYLVMALIYIVIVAVIAGGIKLLERKLKKNER